jgi:hypothetical protein
MEGARPNSKKPGARPGFTIEFAVRGRTGLDVEEHQLDDHTSSTCSTPGTDLMALAICGETL